MAIATRLHLPLLRPPAPPPPRAVTGGGRRFCAKPFQQLEIAESGDAYLCCQGWLPASVGNVLQESVSALWNSARAQEIRRSILDDSFAFCTACPFLGTATGPVRRVDAIEDPGERALLDVGSPVADRIVWLNLAYDRTCNLSCPSCRTDLVVATGPQHESLRVLQARLLEGGMLSQIDWLYVTGSGDPFASRLFRGLLRSIDPTDHPRLKVKLHTNALLFTPEAWSDLGQVRARVREVEVSIDAARAETYAVNRRGGSWDVLLDNLGFISSLRRSGPVRALQLSFVVQANNWREMPDFVELADGFGADRVFFSTLRNWGTFSDEEFRRRAVHAPFHPERGDFLASLADPRLQRPHVTLGGWAD